MTPNDRLFELPDEPTFNAIAIGASAGGPQALIEIVAGLPADLPAAVLVAQHRPADGGDRLVRLLAYRTRLVVKHADQGECVRPGTIYVAPPGRHLEITAYGTACVRRSERIRFVRPSVDLLFQSVADRYGGSSIGVILSGCGADGSRGIRAIRDQSGFTIAQDETTSPFFDMPNAAIETARVDLVLPLQRIAFALASLCLGSDLAMAQQSHPGPVGRQSRTRL